MKVVMCEQKFQYCLDEQVSILDFGKGGKIFKQYLESAREYLGFESYFDIYIWEDFKGEKFYRVKAAGWREAPKIELDFLFHFDSSFKGMRMQGIPTSAESS